MSGMEPLLIGSAIGAATNRKNPIQGAMMGGFLGGAGGALMPSLSSLGGASSGLTPGILPSAASGSMTVATNPALVTSALPTSAANVGFQTAAQQAAAQMPTNIANEAAKQGLFAGTAPRTILGGGPSSVEASILADQPSMFEQLGSYAQRNPVLTQMGLSGAQGLMQQQQQQPAPAGLMRGNPMQVQGPQYQFGPPKVSLI